MLARATTKGAIGGCWVSRMLRGREQAPQSFVASWRTGTGIGTSRSAPAAPAGGLVDTRSVAATFGIFLEIRGRGRWRTGLAGWRRVAGKVA